MCCVSQNASTLCLAVISILVNLKQNPSGVSGPESALEQRASRCCVRAKLISPSSSRASFCAEVFFSWNGDVLFMLITGSHARAHTASTCSQERSRALTFCWTLGYYLTLSHFLLCADESVSQSQTSACTKDCAHIEERHCTSMIATSKTGSQNSRHLY